MLLLVGALLLTFAHPFHYGSLTVNGSWWTLILASLGLVLYIGAAVDHPRPGVRFSRAFFGAMVYFLVTLFWICVALHEFGELHLAVAILGSIFVAAYCAMFWGVWALIAGSKQVRNKPALQKIFCWAGTFAFAEAARQYLILTGFGYGELGFAFHFWPLVARTAGFWGVHGLTFLWVFLAAAVLHYEVWLHDDKQLKTLGIWLLTFIVLAVSGSYLPRSEGTPIPQFVSVVQPNISQEMKWDPHLSAAHLDTLVKMSEELAVDHPNLIVWPETSYPFLIAATQRQLPISTQVPLLIGAVVKDQQYNRNSAVLVSSQQVLGRFDKIHLVPFGEYVPMKEWLPIGKLAANAGDFVRGSTDQPLLAPPESHMRIGPLICYEDAFSRESVRLAKAGANLLVNLTNDAWYGNTSAQAQHTAMAQIMAYSTRLPMIRATNNGISTLISSDRREDLPAFGAQKASFHLEVFENPAKTFFVWTYPLMEWIWLIIFVIAFLWKESRQTKKIFFRR